MGPDFEEVSLKVVLVPLSSDLGKVQFFFDVVATMLLPFMLESRKGVTVYNPQQVMRQFGYDDDSLVTMTR